MHSFHHQLDKYAQLVIEIGVNIQEGQEVFVNASIDAKDLVRLMTKHAYEKGAKNVIVNWADDEITRLKYEKAPLSSFEYFPEWEVLARETLVSRGAAFISVVSSSPDLLKGIEPDRLATCQKTAGTALHKFKQSIQSDQVSWVVVGAAAPEWAKKVFPDLNEKDAVAKLWEAIFKTTRADQADPVQAWKDHNESLNHKMNILNERHFHKLHYTANGTDLEIELPDKHLWVAAGSENEQGHHFIANMPTEEVFTLPKKDGVNGTVSSTKPLSYGGNIIDHFTLTFSEGRIVDVKAEQGEEILKQLIETDEGSHYLGEVALVPDDSPISNSGVLFYNTLYDENASNHLAIGSAYPFNLVGGKTMTQDELKEAGVNQSITHVDFMIGSNQMNIDGIKKDGTREAIFRNGNWAI